MGLDLQDLFRVVVFLLFFVRYKRYPLVSWL
jgi:hypothetical protein